MFVYYDGRAVTTGDCIQLISGPAGLTASWLTRVLVESGAAPSGSEVVVVTTERIGEGKIGCNIRCNLEWASPGCGPASVVAKLPSEDEASRTTGVALGLYAREVGFYRELAERTESRVPACYGAAIDPVSGEFVLVLEDLVPAQVGDQLAGCAVAEAERAIDELARLHASFFGADMPDWVPQGMAENANEVGVLYGMLVPSFLERYEGRLDPDVLGVVECYAEVFVDWGRTASRGPSSLLHGDYRLDNLLFGATGPDGATDRVAAVDWQTVAVGSPVADVAYFIGAGLVPELRREAEAELVERYLVTLDRLGAGAPPREMFDELYRAQSLGGLIMAVVASAMVTEGERSIEMFATMADRHARHALDLDAIELIRRSA